MSIKKVWWFVISIMFFTGCGLKTSPRPIRAEDIGLKPVENPESFYKGSDLVLSWTSPDNPSEFTLEEYGVTRIILDKACLDCPIIQKKIAKIEKGTLQILDPDIQQNLQVSGDRYELSLIDFKNSGLNSFQITYQAAGFQVASENLIAKKKFPLPSPQLDVSVIEETEKNLLVRLKILNLSELPSLKKEKISLKLNLKDDQEITQSVAEIMLFKVPKDLEESAAYFEDADGNRSSKTSFILSKRP